MRAEGFAHDTFAGERMPPPKPPMLLLDEPLKKTTASSELPPRALAIFHGGFIVFAGHPGGKVKFVQSAADAAMTRTDATRCESMPEQ